MLVLRGSMVALITPFAGGELDEPGFRSFVRWQLQQGTDGLVPAGTTGEGATLSAEEHAKVIRICAEEAKGRAPVIAGCGTNSTRSTIENVKRAREAGADAALIVTPYYNKPTQQGLFLHFEAVAKEGGLPVVLYNVPGRTCVDLAAETVARLAKVPGIVAIKEARGQIARVADIRAAGADNFTILAGDDMFTLPVLAMGGQGVISVVGNVAPADLAMLCDAFADGNLEVARNAQIRFASLVQALFCESNPIPVKYALGKMKRASPELRLPLCSISPEGAAKVDRALVAYGGLL